MAVFGRNECGGARAKDEAARITIDELMNEVEVVEPAKGREGKGGKTRPHGVVSQVRSQTVVSE